MRFDRRLVVIRRADACIAEYLGELIYEPTFFCRAYALYPSFSRPHQSLMCTIPSQVTSHIGRSYVFALNNLMSVDAFPAGNGARFINHSPSDEANVGVSSTSCSPHSFIL